jgi:hypothetical protein
MDSAQRHFAAHLEIARRLASQQPASVDAAVDVANSLAQIAPFSVDPGHERGEVQGILAHRRTEGRLPPHGERLLAELQDEPARRAEFVMTTSPPIVAPKDPAHADAHDNLDVLPKRQEDLKDAEAASA